VAASRRAGRGVTTLIPSLATTTAVGPKPPAGDAASLGVDRPRRPGRDTAAAGAAVEVVVGEDGAGAAAEWVSQLASGTMRPGVTQWRTRGCCGSR